MQFKKGYVGFVENCRAQIRGEKSAKLRGQLDARWRRTGRLPKSPLRRCKRLFALPSLSAHNLKSERSCRLLR